MGDLGNITLTKEGKVDKTKVRELEKTFIVCGCEEWRRGGEKIKLSQECTPRWYNKLVFI